MATLEEQNEIAVQALQFKNKVNALIENEEDRSKLFEALRNYLESRKVKKLVRDLKLVLDNSKKYPLFKEIRAFIPPEHLFAFDKLTEGARTGERIVHLKRHGTEPLGFKFKGGMEHGIGIYVTSILPGSAAHVSGLRIGDEILKVNGFVLHESIHDEVVNVLKNKRSLTFVTKNMGKIPNKVNNRIVWQEVDPNMKIAPSDLWDPKFRPLPSGDPQSPEFKRSDDRLLAFKIGKDGLGCSILSGIENFDGVFVSAISPNMLAEQVGLKVGDQILQVNGRIFDKIKHSEAVDALKARKDLTMIVRHNMDVAEYLRRKAKQKTEVLQPILVKEGEEREVHKRATFGDEPVIEYIERNDDSDYEEEDEQIEEASEPGEGNFQFDESITQGKEVHFVSILKIAPLMLDLEMKNDMIVVRNSLKGGAAAENGFLKRGDILLNVEGIDLIGLSSADAQEAISEAMNRLSLYIDLVVASPPGRKRPIIQDASNFSPNKESILGANSDFAKKQNSDSQTEEITDMQSAVARAIAQFESKSPKRSAFLLRRDSLEKAYNSLRVYKEKKRTPVSKSSTPGLSPATSMTTPPAERRNVEKARLMGLTGMSMSLDSVVSPSLPKKSAFSMPDSKPVTISSGIRTPKKTDDFDVSFDATASEPKQKWTSAVRKVSSGLHETTVRGAETESMLQQATAQQQWTFSNQTATSSTAKSSQQSEFSKNDPQHSRKDAALTGSQVPSEILSMTVKGASAKENEFHGKIEENVSPSAEQSRVGSFGVNNNELDDMPLPDNKYKVRAQVHSPPAVSNDEILKTWAPTSPIRGHSTSTENLASRKSVAFDKEVTEISGGRGMLSPTSRSLSLDELNERVEKRYNDGLKDRESHPTRKKSVGFKETVENIEPSASQSYRSLDDVSMIGKGGWDERMNKYSKADSHLLQPKKSALRNSPSPRLIDKNDKGSGQYESHLSSEGMASPMLIRTGRSPDREGHFAGRSSSKGHRFLPSSSLEDDPRFNEEIDNLASSLDPSILIPVPDYDDAAAPIPAVPRATSTQTHHHKTSAPVVKPKKRDTTIGLTNRLLSNAKDKLKRVGFKIASQNASAKAGRETAGKPTKTDKMSPPAAKILPQTPPPPPPPHPPSHPPPPPPPHPPPPLQPSSPTSPQHPAAPPPPQAPMHSFAIASPSPPPTAMSLTQMILNSPVRKAAATRNYEDLERGGGSQSRSDDDFDSDMSPAIAAEMTEDVKIASVVAGKDSAPRPRMMKGAKLVDMTDVLSELKGKVKNNEKIARPFSVHSESPSIHASSYSKSHENRAQTEPESKGFEVFGLGRNSSETSPAKTAPHSRDTRISRRQAKSVADVDSDQLDLTVSGLASASVTPRSGRSDKQLDAKDGAILEMEGTLKEFDDVIRSLDTEL